MSQAIALLNKAKRPVILAGNGIRLSDAQDDFLALIEKLGIPVLTTWKAADFLPEDHPLFAGRPGAVGQRGANFTQQNADWLMILGARMDFGQTAYSHETFARGARKIMVDIDPAEIQKLKMKIDVPVYADSGDFIREFRRQTRKITRKEFSEWLTTCKAWQKKYPVVLPEYWQQRQFVNDYVLIDVLSDELTENDLLIPGSSGACSERTMQAIRVKAGLRIFNSQGLGSMGFGIPAAIGGCLASGKKRTVCIEGDGGFIMNIQELETVKRLNLPIKFFVLNNGGYVSIQTTQKNYFDGHLCRKLRRKRRDTARYKTGGQIFRHRYRPTEESQGYPGKDQRNTANGGARGLRSHGLSGSGHGTPSFFSTTKRRFNGIAAHGRPLAVSESGRIRVEYVERHRVNHKGRIVFRLDSSSIRTKNYVLYMR